jgi:hypothetical protein
MKAEGYLPGSALSQDVFSLMFALNGLRIL